MDANFSRISPMSGSELRELAGRLPLPEGGKALTPPILANLPQAKLDGQTTHYAAGPGELCGAGGVLPAELVGFDRGAEAVTANYSLRSGPATLTIIDYPTPQMAAAARDERFATTSRPAKRRISRRRRAGPRRCRSRTWSP